MTPGYPPPLPVAGSSEACPRRIRGEVGGTTVLDSTAVRYGWEIPNYPAFHVPRADVRTELLEPDGDEYPTTLGLAQRYGLRAPDGLRAGAAHEVLTSDSAGLAGTFRFAWDAVDHWFEEDEEVYVHPRSPYVRVDVLPTTRTVRVELDGVLLAESDSPVALFETGLPTRWYFSRSTADLSHLVPSETRTECPYKGRTSEYWSIEVAGSTHPDLAWSYAFPTSQVLPVAGLVCFLDEAVDVTIDGVPQARPVTRMSSG